MTPLVVMAHLSGPVFLPDGLMLDALLMSAVARRDGLPPALTAADCIPIDIPMQKEPSGRFYLCTGALFEAERSVLQYTNRRAPVEQYSTIGSKKIKRVAISLGANKSYRIPRPVTHLGNDLLTWYCVGESDPIRELLAICTHLGKKRGVGLGKVERWEVENTTPWDGFPVVRDGWALRNLPTDWPGIEGAPLGYRTLLPPYWDKTREELCALPRPH